MNASQTFLNDCAYCRGLTGHATRRSFSAPNTANYTTTTHIKATVNFNR